MNILSSAPFIFFQFLRSYCARIFSPFLDFWKGLLKIKEKYLELFKGFLRRRDSKSNRRVCLIYLIVHHNPLLSRLRGGDNNTLNTINEVNTTGNIVTYSWTVGKTECDRNLLPGTEQYSRLLWMKWHFPDLIWVLILGYGLVSIHPIIQICCLLPSHICHGLFLGLKNIMS